MPLVSRTSFRRGKWNLFATRENARWGLRPDGNVGQDAALENSPPKSQVADCTASLHRCHFLFLIWSPSQATVK